MPQLRYWMKSPLVSHALFGGVVLGPPTLVVQEPIRLTLSSPGSWSLLELCTLYLEAMPVPPLVMHVVWIRRMSPAVLDDDVLAAAFTPLGAAMLDRSLSPS